MPPALPSRLLEMVVHTPSVFTLLPLTHSSINCNLASRPTISPQLLSLKSEIMTSYMTKTTKHFQNFSDLSLNIFTCHIFVTVDTTNHFRPAQNSSSPASTTPAFLSQLSSYTVVGFGFYFGLTSYSTCYPRQFHLRSCLKIPLLC